MNAVEAMKARRLVRYAYEIYDLKPWNHHDKVGILAIQLNNRKTPYYVVFLEQSIVVLPNVAALVGLFMNASFDNMPSIQRLRYQQHLLCSFVTHDEADEASMSLFSRSEASLREDVLPFFESTMPTLLPDMVVKKEIDVLVDVYAQVISALNVIFGLQESIDTDEAMHVWRFSYEDKAWGLDIEPLPHSDIDVHPLKLFDAIEAECLALPQHDDVWEMDVAYTSVMLEQQEHHRQQAIRLCMVTHHDAPLIYSQALVKQEDAHQQLCDELVQCMKERGRPSKIITRDTILVDAFVNICESLSIDLEANETLDTIDLFIEELEATMK